MIELLSREASLSARESRPFVDRNCFLDSPDRSESRKFDPEEDKFLH